MKIFNRKLNRDFKVLGKYEAGIVLSGPEVKSIKSGRVKLEDAYIKILGSEAYLINAHIPLYQYARSENYQPTRSRKILLHKKELIRLKTKLQSARGLTIIPISCYNKGNLIKLEIGLVKGRKKIEKKKLEKEKDLEREQAREIKEYLKK